MELFEVDGATICEPLSLDQARWETCCSPLSVGAGAPADGGIAGVSWVLDAMLPDSEASRAAIAAERAKCVLCKGEFGMHGMAIGGGPSCMCRTKDGGKACTTNRGSCEAGCEIPWQTALEHGGERCAPGEPCTIPAGTCANFVSPHGCRGRIVEDAKGVRSSPSSARAGSSCSCGGRRRRWTRAACTEVARLKQNRRHG